MKLICAKTFPVSGPSSMDVTGNDLLLVRMKEENKCWIRVMHRLSGEIVNQIPSMCDHNSVFVRKYPGNQDYIFESCSRCEEVYAHNNYNFESFSVNKGSKITRMCDGPDGSLLVLKQCGGLYRLNWDKTQAQLVFVQDIPTRPGKRMLRLCYVECHDIFMYTHRNEEVDQDYEIIAVKLGTDNIVWRLSGPVDGCIIKLECIVSDSEGNAYVGDRGSSRILQISSLTGEILSILLFEDEKMPIWSMRWSNMEPNLTLSTQNRISIYFVPK